MQFSVHETTIKPLYAGAMIFRQAFKFLLILAWTQAFLNAKFFHSYLWNFWQPTPVPFALLVSHEYLLTREHLREIKSQASWYGAKSTLLMKASK